MANFHSFLALAFGLSLVPSIASAGVIVVNWTGTIDSGQDITNYFGLGTDWTNHGISGTLTYNTSNVPTDLEMDPNFGLYRDSTSWFSMSTFITNGPTTLQIPFASSTPYLYQIAVADNLGDDNFTLNQLDNTPAGSTTMNLYLQDSSGAALTSEAMPSIFPSFSSWGTTTGQLSLYEDSNSIDATFRITSYTTAVPEPSTAAWLLCASSVICLSRRRR